MANSVIRVLTIQPASDICCQRFYGDMDGDRDVDFLDFIAFRGTFARTSEQSGYNPFFDRDGDGEVYFLGFIGFRQNFGRALSS